MDQRIEPQMSNEANLNLDSDALSVDASLEITSSTGEGFSSLTDDVLTARSDDELIDHVNEIAMPTKKVSKARRPVIKVQLKRSFRHRLTVASSSSILLLVFVVMWGGAVLISRPQNWPISHVEVIGVINQQDQARIQQQLKGIASDGFFNLKLPEWQYKLEQIPWVAQVQLQRVWPDHLRVQVAMRQPAARWGNQALIDISGKVFLPGGKGLPTESGIIDAPDSLSESALALFAASSELLASEQLTIERLRLNQRRSVEIVLKNGLLLKAGDMALAENRLRRMIGVYKKHLSPVLNDIDYVDLRHTHGFAVGWRESVKARKGKNA
ncbi:cell division protein FtsQ/DivIB [Pelagibaculum spongiae]|uniref:Cell division protein FtsQ n=1 Tax=Pelagibaculum spongiae TaxID=2080658 RepID=A0A2V1GZK7_9GAMM|nr:cell division protein FtsQ/DivIB [Pelagibaculum spongiae]PVZ71869.1 hypothetical protein DC094_02260 [Pelagibaculum spongiae]